MKICQSHWGQLRKAIDERGLSGLVAGDGKKAHAAMVRELEGHPEPGDWDPLMSANWAIHSEALHFGGLYLMGEDENGNQYCPLCEADAHGGHAADWIKGCCDAQLEHARELKLVPGVQ
jgi:hypothetical protein